MQVSMVLESGDHVVSKSGRNALAQPHVPKPQACKHAHLVSIGALEIC